MTDHFVEVPKKVLSPAAQAVLDAFLAEWADCFLEQDRRCLGAALRALADQVVPAWKTPPSGEYELEYGQWIAQNRIRRDILAIAGELRAQP